MYSLDAKIHFFSFMNKFSPNIFIRGRGGFICLYKHINLEMMLFIRTFASNPKLKLIH